MSGYDSTIARIRSEDRFGFLAKPFNAEGLTEAIRLALGQRQS
jgi:DNA-binding NtrC family response regulator